MDRKIVLHGVDCYSYTAKQAMALKNAGMQFIFGYFAPTGYTKRMTYDRAKTITDLGLLSANVFETSNTRAQGGAVNGQTDGLAAYQNALEIHMPEHGCIYMAVDYDAPATQYSVIEEYLRAAREQTGKYLLGCYGPHAVIDEMARRGVCDLYWQAYAWNRSGGVSPNAAMHQCSPQQAFAGVNVDLDNAYTLRGLWNLNSDYVELLVKSVQTKIGLASPEEWVAVINGQTPLNPEYLKGLFGLICNAAGISYNSYADVDSVIDLNSDDYWQSVIAGNGEASADNVKALFDKIDIAL